MAQQIFDQYAPLAKVSANETIPVVAAIAQTRDGKDELLHGTVPFVPAGGLYVPVSAANRLPVEATLTGHDGKPLKGVGLSNEVRAGLPNRQAPAAGATTTLLEVTVPCILEWWYWLIHENADADMMLGVYRRTSTGGRVAYFYGLVPNNEQIARHERYQMSQLVDRAAALGVSPVQGLLGGRRAILFKGPLECPYGFTIDVTRVAEPSGSPYMWFTCNYREV